MEVVFDILEGEAAEERDEGFVFEVVEDYVDLVVLDEEVDELGGVGLVLDDLQEGDFGVDQFWGHGQEVYFYGELLRLVDKSRFRDSAGLVDDSVTSSPEFLVDFIAVGLEVGEVG